MKQRHYLLTLTEEEELELDPAGVRLRARIMPLVDMNDPELLVGGTYSAADRMVGKGAVAAFASCLEEILRNERANMVRQLIEQIPLEEANDDRRFVFVPEARYQELVEKANAVSE